MILLILPIITGVSLKAHAAIWVEVEEYRPENASPQHRFLSATDPETRDYLMQFAHGNAPKKILNLKKGVLSFSPLEKGNCGDTPVELCLARIVKVYNCPKSKEGTRVGSCTPVRGIYHGRAPDSKPVNSPAT